MKVFLSAVSSEFGLARGALGRDFRTHQIAVVTQEELSHLTGAATLLELLDTHIRCCDAVVCLIGKASGNGFPTPTEARDYAALLPSEMPRASYTQWEFLLARKHQKRRIVCRPRPEYAEPPYIPAEEPAEPDDPALQAEFVRHIEAQGVPYMKFSTRDELCRLVISQPWMPTITTPFAPAPPTPKPIGLPFRSIGTDFKGRTDFLARLHATLRPHPVTRTAITSAVYGLGGIGKTCTALEYAWAHQDDYTALLFAQADTPANLETALAGLAEVLNLPVDPHDVPGQAQTVQRWLRQHPGWLLILDNADTRDALDAIESRLGGLPHGNLLITTRQSYLPAGIATLELDLLDEPAAIAFLLDRTAGQRRTTPDEADTARHLAIQDLDRLPLALEHAVAYIGRRHCSFTDYRAALRDTPAAALDNPKLDLTRYDRTIAQTWQVSMQDVSDEARALLQRLAFLAPDPVPRTLFDRPVPGVPSDDLAEALTDLTDFSLARHQADGAGVVVHRLVQQVTRFTMDPATQHTRLLEALGWIAAAFVGHPQDVRTWPVLDPLAPHAEAVAGYGDAAGIAEPTLALMGQLGLLFNAKALHARAEAWSRRALAIAEANFPAADPRIAICLNNLAALLQATNRLGEAEPLMRRALAIDEASFGNDHPEVATDLNNLAQLLRATNRLGEAEPLMRRALAIDEASFGNDHPNVAAKLNNFAQLLQATNRLGEAEPLMRRTLAIDEASFGNDHPNVAVRLNNLAQLLQATNRLGEAEPLMRRALAIDEASFGNDHPEVATDLNNLALLLQATNRLGEAEPLIRRALAIDEASFGNDHPNVAAKLNNLAQLLQATNRLGEAEPLMRRALAIDEASFGNDHPKVAIRLNNLARLMQATNRLGEAEPLMRRHLVIFLKFQRNTGHPHPHRDAALGNYAALLRQMGHSEAQVIAERQAALREAGLDSL